MSPQHFPTESLCLCPTCTSTCVDWENVDYGSSTEDDLQREHDSKSMNLKNAYSILKLRRLYMYELWTLQNGILNVANMLEALRLKEMAVNVGYIPAHALLYHLPYPFTSTSRQGNTIYYNITSDTVLAPHTPCGKSAKKKKTNIDCSVYYDHITWCPSTCALIPLALWREVNKCTEVAPAPPTVTKPWRARVTDRTCHQKKHEVH